MTKRLAWAVAALALLVGGAGQAEADIVVTNLANSPANVDGSGLNAAAQSFTTGGLDQVLQSVTLKLRGEAGSIDVFLFSDNAGLPGTSLLHLGTLTPTGSLFADYTLKAASPFTLAANTTYWVEGNYIGSPNWAYTLDPSFSGSGTLGNFTNSTDGGGTWLGPFSGEPYQLQVDASLLGVGTLGLVGYGWRRRSRAGRLRC
jgi:hypothetical protein